MEVQFKLTGKRRYAITIFREGYPTIEMNPAPGYDPIMPHDLVHLIVEKEIGLRRGIFGQIAAGGNAGTFHIVPSANDDKREAARLRRKTARRGEKLLRAGREEAAASERAVEVCLNEWLSRSADPSRKKLAIQLPTQSKPVTVDDDLLTSEVLDRVCASLDKASRQWSSLEIGESLVVNWLERSVTIPTSQKLKPAS